MKIRNYTLTEEQAAQARGIYLPGAEGGTDLLEFVDRYDERPNPMIKYRVKGIPMSAVQVTLSPDRPLIEHIDLRGEEADIEKIVDAVDNDFGVQLAFAIPRP